jgi:hypothetical protein
MYTVEQRVFLVRKYRQTGSFKARQTYSSCYLNNINFIDNNLGYLARESPCILFIYGTA